MLSVSNTLNKNQWTREGLMNTRRMLRSWLAGLAVVLATTPAIATATDAHHTGELSYAELAARLTAVESELNSGRNSAASYDSQMPPAWPGSTCRDACDACASPAWYAGYEITFLKPYISDNEFVGGWDGEYGTGNRFTIGYDGGEGLGARLRYWLYNHNHGDAAGNPFVHLDMDVADAEMTLSEKMRQWDLMVSGGVRYGKAGFGFAAGELYFEGVGPTVSLEAIRGIGSSRFFLIGGLRTSVLFGQNGGAGAAFQAADDETAVILDNQLGLGWNREIGAGLLTLRTVWESQYWHNASLGDDVYGFGSALGFSGPSLSAELRF
jgi:hypothetical protein